MAATSAMGPVKRFFAVRVMPAVVVLIGVLAIWIGVADWRRADTSADWPSVEGMITRSAVGREESGGGGRPRSVTYVARVAYAYAVDGIRHEGRRISYGHYDSAEEADADAVAGRYPVGAQVKVHYMPGHPGESVLEPGTQGTPWLILVLGAVFASVGGLLVVVAPRIVAKAK
jgi:hypothetical protein